MSGLAHYFEAEGLATTLIALVREHAEKVKPPRALWVPFELGRPLGAPNDPDFQREVARSALGLLERKAGPVILEDYDHEASGRTADPDWTCPVTLGGEDVSAEVESVRPAYERAVEKFGRTTVGVTNVPIEQVAAFLEAFDSDSPLPSPNKTLAGTLMLRFGADDLRAYYLEAAASGEGNPSSRQLQDWFWNEARAAKLLRSLRRASLDSPDEGRKEVGTYSLVSDGYEEEP